MKRKGTTKIAAFLLSGILLTGSSIGIIPGNKQNSLLDSAIITASAVSYYDQWLTDIYTSGEFKFRINSNENDLTAYIVGTTNQTETLTIPQTVKATKNGITNTYNVVKLDNLGYNALKKVDIPCTVTTLAPSAFNGANNLTEVHFTVNGSRNDNRSGIYKTYWSSIPECSPFVQNQYNKYSKMTDNYRFALVGNCLMYFSDYKDSTTTILDLSNTNKYGQIKYIGTNAFVRYNRLQTIKLPQNLIGGSENAFQNAVENVSYYDASAKTYRDLATYYKTKSACDILMSGIFGQYSEISKKVFAQIAKTAFQKSDLKITYRGSVYSGYNAWEQYQIVHKLYTYIGKNYYHYNRHTDKSIDYYSEMIQTEVLGKKGSQTGGIACADYANMFAALCIAAGVNAVKVGTIQGQCHAFNVVKIGSQWFNIDCCAGWLGGTKTFLTPDGTIETIGSHTKEDADKTKYNCNRSIGDVNLDGFVDMADAQIILNAYTALASHMTPQFPEVTKCRDINYLKVLCDVDRNGKVEVKDAQLVCNYATAVTTRKRDRTGALYTSFEQYYWDQCGVENGKYEGSWNQFLIPSMQNPPA